MDVVSLTKAPAARRLGPIPLAIAVAAVAGASGLVYPTSYAPVFVAATLAAVAALVLCLQRPVLALYAALFAVFLPMGLIPPDLQSKLNRYLTVFACCTYLLALLTRRQRLIWTPAAWLMLAFLIWATVTMFWIPDASVGSNKLQTYGLRLALFLVLTVNLVRTRRDLNGLMTTLALSGWLLLAIGLRTVILEGYTPGTRFQVVDANENWMGLMALLALPGVVWHVFNSPGRWRAIRAATSYVFLAATLLLIALTGSRGSAISIVVALGVVALWKPARRWAGLGLVVIVLMALLAPAAFATLVERFTQHQNDTLLGGREVLWQSAWQLIRDHLITGVGIGYAPYAILSYAGASIGIATHEIASIHNPVLTMWAETGLLGVLLYLAVPVSAVWLFIRQFLRCQKTGPTWLKPYFVLVAAASLGYMASWVKGGGMESDFSYFLVIALLLIPSGLCTGRAVTASAERIGESDSA